jgi:hypothetical protein
MTDIKILKLLVYLARRETIMCENDPPSVAPRNTCKCDACEAARITDEIHGEILTKAAFERAGEAMRPTNEK